MEFASSLTIRNSLPDDSAALTRLLETAPYTHWHVDWRLPVDWLGNAGFVVAEGADGAMSGCLAVIPDPPPAAWVRVAAFMDQRRAPQLLSRLWQQALVDLHKRGIREVAWILPNNWPTSWLTSLRFQPVAEIETFVKEDLSLPLVKANHQLELRALREEDLPALEAIEAAAFAPIWRHSLDGLALGSKAAISFQVAELDGRVVGFQYSALGQGSGSVHLVRLTVHPEVQGKQVGSALLDDAIRGYWERQLTKITLNTQVDNLPSQRLYAKFGFYPAGTRVPVWGCSL